MRIALLSDGRNVHTRRWAKYFQGQGDELLLLTCEAPDEMPVPARRIGPRLPVGFLNYTLAVPAARRLLARWDPDLINAHFLPNYGWMAWLCGRRPWVLSTWGSDILVNPGRSPLHRWRARRVLRAADLITSDAQMLSEAIRALGGDDLAPLTVPMGIGRELLKQPVPAEGREPVILHNRNLEPVYDLPTVLRGLAGFFAVRPDWRARLAGDGSQRSELESLAASLGIAGKVDWLGRVPRERLFAELGRVSVYLSASLSDSTSVSLLEAMALGAHPVLSDIPANREWIDGPPGAQYFPPGQPEALCRALLEADALSAERRRAAGEANRAVVTEYAIWEDNMAELRKSYLKLLEGRA